MTNALDSMLAMGGHNNFLGGYDKDDAVRSLRELQSCAGHRPTAEDVERYALTSGETDVDGARRLRGWWEAILEGRKLKGDCGRSI